MESIKMIIGGDLVPTQSNYKYFKNGDINKLLGEELENILKESDYRIFNLEAPITMLQNPIKKCGPSLKIDPLCFNGIKKLNPTLLNLANNHILDQGSGGLIETINILKKNNIKFIGVGENLQSARKGYILEKNNIKIGIYSCAEREFSIATETKIGANPFSFGDTLDDVIDLKKNCDYMIVLYHGGKEHYRYPAPYLQKRCRKMIEKGADIVICQHSHCIGSLEKYQLGQIIYGQGNFIFDYDDNEFWNTSILVELKIDRKLIKVNCIPILKKRNIIKKANLEEEKKIIFAFNKRNEEIKNKDIVEQKYNKLSENYFYNYLGAFSGLGRIITGIDRKFLKNIIMKFLFNEKKKLMLLNYLECEAHRDLFIEGLKNNLKMKGREKK